MPRIPSFEIPTHVSSNNPKLRNSTHNPSNTPNIRSREGEAARNLSGRSKAYGGEYHSFIFLQLLSSLRQSKQGVADVLSIAWTPLVRFFGRTLCGEMQCSVTKLPLLSYYRFTISNGKPLGPHLIPSCSCRLASSVVPFVDRVLLMATNIRISSSTNLQPQILASGLPPSTGPSRLDSGPLDWTMDQTPEPRLFLCFVLLLLSVSFLGLVCCSGEPVGLVGCWLSKDLLALLTPLGDSQVSLQHIDSVGYWLSSNCVGNCQLYQVLLAFKLVRRQRKLFLPGLVLEGFGGSSLYVFCWPIGGQPPNFSSFVRNFDFAAFPPCFQVSRPQLLPPSTQ